jgi:hypothetical protein
MVKNSSLLTNHERKYNLVFERRSSVACASLFSTRFSHVTRAKNAKGAKSWIIVFISFASFAFLARDLPAFVAALLRSVLTERGR